MESWRTATLDRIRALGPSKVLEIGVGSGLLLSKLDDEVEEYWATDFSHHAIAGLKQRFAHTDDIAAKVCASVPTSPRHRRPASFSIFWTHSSSTRWCNLFQVWITSSRSYAEPYKLRPPAVAFSSATSAAFRFCAASPPRSSYPETSAISRGQSDAWLSIDASLWIKKLDDLASISFTPAGSDWRHLG